MVRIIIQGLGFMGRIHAQCYASIPRAEVVGLVDLDVDRAAKVWQELGGDPIPVADSVEQVLKVVDADVVDICLPTDAHPQAAEIAFSAGLHVFCEKPIALDLAAAGRITDAAAAANRELMIGHCIRFWPEYLKLKSMIDSGEAGKLLALDLFRRSPRPGYTVGDWASDPLRCQGAALDLHIHDTDFVHFLFGSPKGVFSQGIYTPTGLDHIQTQYLFNDLVVRAEGGWSYPDKRPFQMGYCALFENGSLDCDISGSLKVRKIVGDHSQELSGEEDTCASLSGLAGYKCQLDYFINCIAEGVPVEINTGSDATESLRTIRAEFESVETGTPVYLAGISPSL
tara:strand:- start:11552 stop:12574 length:1023 start_codon:yes stop_codon:yes gene_type:complete